jgi:hypothetical protein
MLIFSFLFQALQASFWLPRVWGRVPGLFYRKFQPSLFVQLQDKYLQFVGT